MNIDRNDVMSGAVKAFEGHGCKRDVRLFKENLDKNIDVLYEALKNRSYVMFLNYRKLTKVNNDGKIRHIDSPSLITRIYQHTFILKMLPLYNELDPEIAYNCKEGYGITANNKEKSMMHHLKDIYFDKKEYHYCLIIDQRHCYEHVTTKLFRKSLKRLTTDKDIIEFGVNVCMVNEKLPIGTPTSPFVHHIIMLGYDKYIKEICKNTVRFADDNFIPFETKEEAQQVKWRVKNYWWYELGIRAKHNTTAIVPLSTPTDFCGYVYHRNMGQTNHHNKGYVTMRKRTTKAAMNAKNNKSWASYFGLMKNADCYSLMTIIEERNMKLNKLTEKIRINRSLDAKNIEMKYVEGNTITVIDYEIRQNKGIDNWIKCLIGIEEIGDNNEPTGRILAREFHGNYQGIIRFIRAAEKAYSKEDILPIEDAEIVNQCGYIFKDSTNQLKYIEND